MGSSGAHIGTGVTMDDPAFIHHTAQLYGKVHIGAGVSIWPYVVTRAEMFDIQIGARSNIQDHVMIHVGYRSPTVIGEDCSITHRVTLHGCEIGDRCLIGINATIMDGARIGANSIVAGHSIVTENSVFPDNAIIAGVPAKQVGTRDNSAANLANARFYEMNGRNYAAGHDRLSPEQLNSYEQSLGVGGGDPA